MATGYFKIGGETIEVFGPHVADGEGGEDELALDEHEQRALLAILDRHEASATEPLPDDFRALQGALRRSLAAA